MTLREHLDAAIDGFWIGADHDLIRGHVEAALALLDASAEYPGCLYTANRPRRTHRLVADPEPSA